MVDGLAYCAEIPLPDSEPGAPAFVHLLPLGEIVGRDGRRWTLKNPNAVIAASLRSGVDLPIDYEHQADDPARQKNGPVPAAGWIKALEVRPDGIWGEVEWTATAAELIAAKSYRYLSPVLHFDPATRAVIRLTGAGLVHHPNLELKALAAEEFSMPQSSTDLRVIAEALGIEDASTAGILAAINSARQPDPAAFVPIAAVRELLADRNATVALMSEREITRRVDDAVIHGHITPALKEWATALCRQNPDSFDEFMKAPAAWGHMFKPQAPSGRPLEAHGRSMSAEARAICDPVGYRTRGA